MKSYANKECEGRSLILSVLWRLQSSWDHAWLRCIKSRERVGGAEDASFELVGWLGTQHRWVEPDYLSAFCIPHAHMYVYHWGGRCCCSIIESCLYNDDVAEREKLKQLLLYSRRLSSFNSRAVLVQECLDEILENGKLYLSPFGLSAMTLLADWLQFCRKNRSRHGQFLFKWEDTSTYPACASWSWRIRTIAWVVFKVCWRDCTWGTSQLRQCRLRTRLTLNFVYLRAITQGKSILVGFSAFTSVRTKLRHHAQMKSVNCVTENCILNHGLHNLDLIRPTSRVQKRSLNSSLTRIEIHC